MPFVSARRRILKALSALAGLAAIAPRYGSAQPPPSPQPPPSSASDVRVAVLDWRGQHLGRPASVTLRRADGRAAELRRVGDRLTYQGRVEPGSYRLRITADADLAGVDYDVTIAPGNVSIPVYLGRPGWPSYRMGQSLVAFEPADDRVAVAFAATPSTERVNALLAGVDDVRLETDPDKAWAEGEAVVLLRARPGAKIFTREGRTDVIDRLARQLPADARIGLPIDVVTKAPSQPRGKPVRQVKILDNQYVVRFAAKHPPERIREFARAHDATAEPAAGLVDTWLFKFNERSNYRKHLETVESWRSKPGEPRILYAEPNLIFSLNAHQCNDSAAGQSCAIPPSRASNDPWSVCQTNLLLQRVPDAWCYLEQRLGAGLRFGSPDVCIATVDIGINERHPDIDGSLVQYVSLCDGCQRAPDDAHGIAVLGIVSAKSGNGKGVSGIAPGVRHVAVQLRSDWRGDPLWYAQMITWLAGVEQIAGFPALARAADIISCSHGSERMPTPSTVADAFARATREGRKLSSSSAALGTVLVYSAGNGDTDMLGTQALATDTNVISVGNTLAPDPTGLEKRAPDSNYGEDLDLCAQGDGAPSLYLDPDDTLSRPDRCLPDEPSLGGYFFFGTSAACPMVAAAAALMLTMNKQLTSQQVREKLRQTARCVDPVNGNWHDDRSDKYGSGRLDVHAAVKAADPSPPGPG